MAYVKVDPAYHFWAGVSIPSVFIRPYTWPTHVGYRCNLKGLINVQKRKITWRKQYEKAISGGAPICQLNTNKQTKHHDTNLLFTFIERIYHTVNWYVRGSTHSGKFFHLLQSPYRKFLIAYSICLCVYVCVYLPLHSQTFLKSSFKFIKILLEFFNFMTKNKNKFAFSLIFKKLH